MGKADSLANLIRLHQGCSYGYAFFSLRKPG
jgi:hypothetical protein